MTGPPRTPELGGSTSDSIAWPAIAASTALPPRLSTFNPACAASGLAAMTKGSVVAATGAVRGACAAAQADMARLAKAAARLRKRRMPLRLAQQEWRFKTIPLRSAAGE